MCEEAVSGRKAHGSGAEHKNKPSCCEDKGETQFEDREKKERVNQCFFYSVWTEVVVCFDRLKNSDQSHDDRSVG